jgi:hypothetical protein
MGKNAMDFVGKNAIDFEVKIHRKEYVGNCEL